ncbi:MAG: hypothetical protein HON94_15210 [Methylococcales bacterium]|jgi:hypothetical protein|nr:hypothetical protein [Methylococcales bacterium]MBT7408518.1 hypothetical protein [Methylococcales bacterium]
MKKTDNNILRFISADKENQVTDSAELEKQLNELNHSLAQIGDVYSADKMDLQLQLAHNYLQSERQQDAWDLARIIVDDCIQNENWQHAVEAYDVMFLSDQNDFLCALGQGVWLAVTFPIDPEVSVAMLEHIIDETADDSDGAAVAAATAVYIADIRCEGKHRENLMFFANNLLGKVAERHSQIDSEAKFEFWLQKLELTDPACFLVRLRNVIDVLVQDEWWFDREKLQQLIPDQ